MTTFKEDIQLALDALNNVLYSDCDKTKKAIATLEDRLANWLDKPVAWLWRRDHSNGGYTERFCYTENAAKQLAEDSVSLPNRDSVLPLYLHPAEPTKPTKSNCALYNMEEGEIIQIRGAMLYEILRVPGGWVYTSYDDNGANGYNLSSCFVPFHDEFRWTDQLIRNPNEEDAAGK